MLAAVWRERKMFASPPRTIEACLRYRWRAKVRRRASHCKGAQEYGTHREPNNTHPPGIQTCADAMGYQEFAGLRWRSAGRPPRGSVRRPPREKCT